MVRQHRIFLRIILTIIIIALIVVISFFSYINKEGGVLGTYKDRSTLIGAFRQIPIYSASGDCAATRFDTLDNYFDYNPQYRCSYNSNSPLDQVVEKYTVQLKQTGWICVRDDYSYQQAAGKRKAYSTTYVKDNLALEIYVTALPEGTVWNGQQVELGISKTSNNRTYSNNKCNSWNGFE